MVLITIFWKYNVNGIDYNINGIDYNISEILKGSVHNISIIQENDHNNSKI